MDKAPRASRASGRPFVNLFVLSGEVDFVAEDNQPPSDLHWGKNNTIWSLAVLSILLKGLQDELWRGSAGEAKTNDIHVGKLARCAENSHRLSRAWRTAEHQGLVL
jgi:hypothetical protein